MARSNRKKSGTTAKNAFNKFEFINYQLSKEEKQACTKWISEQSIDVLSVFDELTDDGYKLSISKDTENSVAYATLTDKGATEEFKNKVLSIKGRDASSAIMRLFWIHFVMAQAQWENITADVDEDIW